MLKKILVFCSILYLFPLGFYFWAVLPECLACNENTPTDFESIYIKDFWGNEVQCVGDNAEFNSFFHFWYVVFLAIISIPLFFGWFYWLNVIRKSKL